MKIFKTELIAEVGQAHDGSLGILHSYIDAIATTGVQTIKFQVHIAEAESSIHEPFRINFSYEDKTRYDYWKRVEFSLDQWIGIKNHCEEVGLEFLASPFSNMAVDLLEKINVKRYKIGSGEVTNFLMLHKIAQTGKPIILSSGMSSFDELDKAIKFIEPYGNEIAILQCTTNYPTSAKKVGLNVISELKEKYPKHKVGLSEHTGQIFAGLAATTLGANILEFHVVFDRKMFGPDSNSSLTIDEVTTLSKGVKFINDSLNHPIDKTDNSEYGTLKTMFEKSLSVNKNLQLGHTIKIDDLETKKPAGFGINASEYKSIIGKKLIRNIQKNDFINYIDLQ